MLNFAVTAGLLACAGSCCLVADDSSLPQKTCAELQRTAADDEMKAAADGWWSKSTTGAIFRGAIVNLRAHKRIAAQCAAEGNNRAAQDARLDLAQDVVDNYPLFLEFMGYRQSLSDLEEKRFDKQVGAASSGAGTTSLTTKGSVPSLLGFAVENGAMTRSVSGTTVTFRAVPWDVVTALANHNYLASATTPQSGTLAGLLSDVSLAVSFDTSRGSAANSPVLTGDKQQVSGYTAHFQVLNWRDPRNIRYAQLWDRLRNQRGQDLANRLNRLANLVRSPSSSWAAAFEEWRKETIAQLEAASLDDVAKVVTAQAQKFKQIVEANPDLAAQVKVVGNALSDYFVNRNDDIKRITKSPTLAFEYSGIAQANTNGSVPVASGTPPASLPNLSSFKLIFGKGFLDGPELTANFSATLFNSHPAGATGGSLRDVQGSAQLDVPLPEILKTTNMVLSFSGQFVSLRQEPLGAPLIVNTKPVSTKGNIGLAQAKLTVPVKGTGVEIPISITWSNRTELILESDVRANFGITFDLDKLFAKP